MMLKTLSRRLILAIVVLSVLMTAILLPLFQAYLDARLDADKASAEAMLEAGQATLRRGMNESFNDILGIAQQPLLRRYLTYLDDSRGGDPTPAPGWEARQLSDQLRTQLVHARHYTKVVLLDTQGQELFRAHHGPPRPPVSRRMSHADAAYFQAAMQLNPRDLYISPPGHQVSYENTTDGLSPVIDIATPVFDTHGEKKGVLLLSLDWQYLTAALRQDVARDQAARLIMVDATGRWLLPGHGSVISLGQPVASHFPMIWASLSQEGPEPALNDRLLLTQTIDMRTQDYRSLVESVGSLPSSHPWHLGLLLPKPSLATLLSESLGVRLIPLLYGLALLLGVSWAVSSHRQQALKRQAQRYASEVRDLYEHAPCGYHSLDADGRIVRMNRTELDWLGYHADEVIDRRYYRDFVTPATREAFDAAFHSVLGPNQEGAAECELVTRDGTLLPVAIQASASITSRGFKYTRAMVFDLTERKRLETTLAKQAMTDPLTALGNRRYLEDQAALEKTRAQQSGQPLSLAVVDLDHFKQINDAHGHEAGDKVLQAFAETANAVLRDGDVLCRTGGEEFTVLLPNTSQDQAIQVAERLRTAIEHASVRVGSQDHLSYTASCGVTTVLPTETSLLPAVRRADQGLYRAKEQGRNRVNCVSVSRVTAYDLDSQ
ncbi:diguanylate cyclase [Halomonas sp. YLGW01]|uniref:diguanylate cyclase n=1 Tax=Halomonas sp. YLGW01 TaxID=2773308 RepID=UPI001783A80D|nr:diguanylate cyclase [Halomonas sp. YLGW01]